MKKTIGFISAILVILILVFSSSLLEVSYHVSGRGVVMPVEEWGLYRGTDGGLLHIHENHLSGIVNEFGVSEIQRGDVARYVFDDALIKRGSISRGDTIARLFTSDIQLKIIELQGELSYQWSLLASLLAGEKPEDIRVAENRVKLALQELENQQLMTNRVVHLYEESVVSRQEYELALHDLKIKEQSLEIAQSLYNALMTGRKSEDLQVIRSRISSLESQIQQLEKHIEAFHIVSPVSGQVIRERNPLLQNADEVVLRVADFSTCVVLLPVDYAESIYLTEGQEVSIKSPEERIEGAGKLASIDRTIRMVSSRPKVFLTILVTEDNGHEFLRNMMVEVQVDCGKISFWEYLNRLSNSVYHN